MSCSCIQHHPDTGAACIMLQLPVQSNATAHPAIIASRSQIPYNLPAGLQVPCGMATPVHLLDSVASHCAHAGTDTSDLRVASGNPLTPLPAHWDAAEAQDPWSLQAVTNFFHQASFSPMSDTSLGTTPK